MKVNYKLIIRLFLLKIFSVFFLTNSIDSKAQQILEENKISIDTTYLKSKNEMQDYILDTGDTILIRFKNRPKKGFVGESISKNNILYLEPRGNLKNYILDSGDTVFLEFVNHPEFSGNYTINNEGETFLPRIKDAYIKGLKISELKILLEKKYEDFLISPEINITISNFKFIPNGVFNINEEGEIFLPELKNDQDERSRKAYVRGLTTNGLQTLLEKRYSKYLINPKAFISIIKYKPIRIAISGEVRNPGLIKLPSYSSNNISNYLEVNSSVSSTQSNQLKTSNFNPITSLSEVIPETESFDIESNLGNNLLTNEFDSQSLSSKDSLNQSTVLNDSLIKKDSTFLTTLSNAIQKAGGLTSYSDLSNIKIVRDIPIEKGGGKKKATINFKSFLDQGDDKNDIRLFDGDSIFIPKLKKRDLDILPKSVLNGLSPKFIKVKVSGKIENTGVVEIPIEGSLSDVMNLNGPRKPLSGKIFLIRYNQDGTLLRKNINYSANASVGSERNPYLLDGDSITIKNSVLGYSTEFLRAVTEPFVGIYATKEMIQTIAGE